MISIMAAVILIAGLMVMFAGGLMLAGLILMLSCGYFKKHYMEWAFVVAVMNEAKRQGRSIFKGPKP